MVFHKERDNERPPLSCILPHLYLGAETDVTQDSLSARGISYVLSVSRCSPQPTFLPKSQYLRIPIDDSLRDDLLPWIPQALRFIDGAMSLGCSVLVHCAAGISRSPALAVAYIMYRLGMDLDHAYRFVKERRPSISPNFNFLGQLQLFQGTLSPALSSPHYPARPSDGALDTLQSSVKTTSNRTADYSPPPALLSTKLHSSGAQDVKNSSTSGSSSRVHAEDKNVNSTHRREASHNNNTLTQSHQDPIKQQDSTTTNTAATAQSVKRAATQCKSPEFTLSLSDKLKSLTLNLQPIEVQRPSSSSSSLENSTAQQCNNNSTSTNNPKKPASLHIPTDAAGSISEKRKRLTLALTPVSASLQKSPQQQQQQQAEESSNKSKKRGDVCQDPTCSLQLGHRGETGGAAQHKSRKSLRRRADEEKERLMRRASKSRRSSNSQRSSSRSITRRKDRQSQDRGAQRDTQATPSLMKHQQQGGLTELRGARPERGSEDLITPPSSSTLVRGSLHKASPSAAMEGSSGEDALVSPLSLTVNKLLDWGERMLLGVLLGPRIKVAQPALPYRC